jgi:hypothetical protein
MAEITKSVLIHGRKSVDHVLESLCQAACRFCALCKSGMRLLQILPGSQIPTPQWYYTVVMPFKGKKKKKKKAAYCFGSSSLLLQEPSAM